LTSATGFMTISPVAGMRFRSNSSWPGGNLPVILLLLTGIGVACGGAVRHPGEPPSPSKAAPGAVPSHEPPPFEKPALGLDAAVAPSNSATDATREASDVDASPPCSDADLSASDLVARLGMSQDADPSCSIRQLHAHAREAVPLLVRALQVVPPEPKPGEREAWWRAIWSERALRSITGQKFEFPTSQKTVRVYDCTADEKTCPDRWVRNTGEPMPFFWERMSQASVYVAPVDVQQQVIEAWKKWANANAATFTVQAYNPRGDWFW
jgi:hypothetical protein